jgi:hypothetical protein
MHDELDPIDEASASVSSPFSRSRHELEAPSTLAVVKRLELAGITVVEENWAVGSARRGDVAAGQAQVAVVYIAEGQQWGYCPTGSVLLGRGALVVSPAGHPWAFRVIEPLRKFTFLFPDQDIAGLPRAVESPYAVITPEAPLGAVVSDFFEGLTRRLDALPEGSRSDQPLLSRPAHGRAAKPRRPDPEAPVRIHRTTAARAGVVTGNTGSGRGDFRSLPAPAVFAPRLASRRVDKAAAARELSAADRDQRRLGYPHRDCDALRLLRLCAFQSPVPARLRNFTEQLPQAVQVAAAGRTLT